ncbi:MAG: glycosyltransferase [Chitinophagaceae bacterium]|nr:MAG: glycosyltransferase [Chitinophagaceae bacterium]
MADHLHIVCFDVPFPPEHGGFTDLFYKIKWLHKLGVKIHLHCFTKGSAPAPEVEAMCVSAKYYKRRMYDVSLRVPYIVSTRRSDDLLVELQKDDHPVLLEGIHCTWWLMQNRLSGRSVFVRLHNAEHIYYANLALHEGSFLKRRYFLRESGLLRQWEQTILSKNAKWLTVSRRDSSTFRLMQPDAEIHYLPVFTGHNAPLAHSGSGEFCLYHGNLSVNENEAAASWLISEVFSKLDTNLMIAGKNPSAQLLKLASKFSNIHVIANPSISAMNELMGRAHIHVLPSFNETGVKLKVLNALYLGRFVLANRNAIEGTSVESLCRLAEDAAGFRQEILQLMKQEYSTSDIRNRYEVLSGAYNNEMNALHLSALIFPHYPTPSRPPS